MNCHKLLLGIKPFRLMKMTISNMGLHKVGNPLEQGFSFIQIFPREVRDVVLNIKFGFASDHALQNPCGYQTVQESIMSIQKVKARLARDIEPQNLLFLFCYTMESLANVEIAVQPFKPYFHKFRQEHNQGEQESKPQNRAVIVYKFRNAQILQELVGQIKNKKADGSGGYYVTWSNFEKFGKSLNDFSSHKNKNKIFSKDVKEKTK